MVLRKNFTKLFSTWLKKTSWIHFLKDPYQFHKKRGTITLIPKVDVNPASLKNWHPITLPNVDFHPLSIMSISDENETTFTELYSYRTKLDLSVADTLAKTRLLSDIIQLSPEGEVNSGGYIPRREASRYISTALHRPWGG